MLVFIKLVDANNISLVLIVNYKRVNLKKNIHLTVLLLIVNLFIVIKIQIGKRNMAPIPGELSLKNNCILTLIIKRNVDELA